MFIMILKRIVRSNIESVAPFEGPYAPASRSSPAPELNDSPAIAFRWPARRELLELNHSLPLRGCFHAQFSALLRLAVERLRDRRWAAHLAQKQDFHLKIPALICHSQHVSNANFARRFGGLSIGPDSAQLACPRG
jgi:hypothetical protein